MKAATKLWLKDNGRYFIGCCALGLFLVIYRESNGFKNEVGWLDWFGLVFIATILGAVIENLISNGVAKGIAKARKAEIESDQKVKGTAAFKE